MKRFFAFLLEKLFERGLFRKKSGRHRWFCLRNLLSSAGRLQDERAANPGMLSQPGRGTHVANTGHT